MNNTPNSMCFSWLPTGWNALSYFSSYADISRTKKQMVTSSCEYATRRACGTRMAVITNSSRLWGETVAFALRWSHDWSGHHSSSLEPVTDQQLEGRLGLFERRTGWGWLRADHIPHHGPWCEGIEVGCTVNLTLSPTSLLPHGQGCGRGATQCRL